MDFPVDRYRRAGATPQEIALHYELFESLPDLAKQAQLDRLSGLADADLAEELQERRGRSSLLAGLEGADGHPEVGLEGEGAVSADEARTLLGVVSPPEPGDVEDPAEEEEPEPGAGPELPEPPEEPPAAA